MAVETALSSILCVFSAAQTAYNSEVLQLSPSDRTVPTIKEEGSHIIAYNRTSTHVLKHHYVTN